MPEPVSTSTQEVVMKTVNEFANIFQKQLDQLKENGVIDPEVKDQVDRQAKQLDELRALINRPELPQGALAKSIGAAVINDDRLKDFAKRGYHKGGESVLFPTLFGEEKTLITTTAVGNSTSGILTPDRYPGIVKPGVRRMRVRDLMPRFQTTSNAIEFVKENVFTNNASPQTEGSDKAESALTFTIATAPVRTIAHWIPATRQILDDFTMLQAYIDQRLIDGLKDVEDYELLRGTGTGNHITGLIPSATAYDTSMNVAGDTRLDKIRHALRQVELALLTSDGVVVNPSDWEGIELIKTEEGGANRGTYLMGGPGNSGPMNVWRQPVVSTTAMPAGFFLVGAFSTGAAVWDRMDARIDVSTEHSDYFIKNLVAIRAEERIALTVFRGQSFIYGAF